MASVKKGITQQPKIKFKSYEWNASHGNKFAVITLNDTVKANTINANAPKFSVYIGNGTEPFKSKNGKKIANFDPTDVDQKTVAAQFHVTSLTDVSVKNLIKNAKDPVKNKSAIKGRADFVEFIGNDAIILNASTVSRSSSGQKSPTGPGGVHIYTGDRDASISSPSQPMVLGDYLENELFSIKSSVDQLSKSVIDISKTLLTMKLAIIGHIHPPPGTAPSPSIAVQFIPEMATNDLKFFLKGITDTVNNKIKFINSLPFTKSDTKYKSTYNTVN